MDRRTFLSDLALSWAAFHVGGESLLAGATDITASRIPRWRGFNLQGNFPQPGRSPGGSPGSVPYAYEEFDFATMAEWKFDFARLPLSYWVWGSRDDWSLIREEPLKEIDRAIELGRQYGIHINLNFHRIPGYCINDRNLEPVDLFTSPPADRDRALAAGIYYWKAFARRYKGIPNSRLSFDLINEPPKMKTPNPELESRYVEIVKALVGGIREVDPNRLIFADGLDIGQAPVLGIVDLGLVQSTRGYIPKAVSHYTANWVPPDEFESLRLPTWPFKDDAGVLWDRARLGQVYVDKYRPLIDRKVQIHVGEWGCFNRTPHDVALAWMKDCLSVWKDAGWGFSLWNLRGSFGVMDSARLDVQYEDYKGHKLDRKMIELLKAY